MFFCCYQLSIIIFYLFKSFEIFTNLFLMDSKNEESKNFETQGIFSLKKIFKTKWKGNSTKFHCLLNVIWKMEKGMVSVKNSKGKNLVFKNKICQIEIINKGKINCFKIYNGKNYFYVKNVIVNFFRMIGKNELCDRHCLWFEKKGFKFVFVMSYITLFQIMLFDESYFFWMVYIT